MAGIGSALQDAARLGAWTLEQGAALLRTVAGEGGRGSEVVAPESPPATQRPDPQRDTTPKDVDDVTIARKVESVIFRPRGRPKATVDVNVVDGVVWLRGVARSPEMIRKLEAEAREIPEVVDVQNLLHLPHTPAPTRADTPAEMQHTRRRKDSPPRPRVEPRRLNADKTVRHGEPLPEELAQQHRGRPAAPFGSHEPEAGAEGGPGASGAGASGAGSGAGITGRHGEPLPEELAQQHRGRPAAPFGSHEPEAGAEGGAGASGAGARSGAGSGSGSGSGASGPGGLAEGAPERPEVPSPFGDAGGGGGGPDAA